MKTDINQADMDRLENMYQTKAFSTLTSEEKYLVLEHVTEEEYIAMFEVCQAIHKNQMEDITPSESVKNKLNAAWLGKKRKKSPFKLRNLLYQSAAALLFFLLGLGVRNFFEKTPEVIHDTLEVEVVKYVDRPIKEIQYVEVPAKEVPHKDSKSQPISLPESVEEYWAAPEHNSGDFRQQEIVLGNINLALNETTGISLGDDTLLQKMLVTIR